MLSQNSVSVGADAPAASNLDATLLPATFTRKPLKDVVTLLAIKNRPKSFSARERKRMIEEQYLARIAASRLNLSKPKNQHDEECEKEEVHHIDTAKDASVNEPQQHRPISADSSISDTCTRQKSQMVEKQLQPSSLQRALVKDHYSSDASVSTFSYKRKKNRIPVSKLIDLPSSNTKPVDEPVSSLQIAVHDKQPPVFNPHKPVVVTGDVIPQAPPPRPVSSLRKKKTKKNKKQRKQQRMYQKIQQEMQQQAMFQQQQQMYHQMPPPGMVYNDGRGLPPPHFYSQQHHFPPMYPPNQHMYHPSPQELAMNYQHHDPNNNNNMWSAPPPPSSPLVQQGSISDASNTTFSNCSSRNVSSVKGSVNGSNNFMPYPPPLLPTPQHNLNYDPRSGYVSLGDASSVHEFSHVSYDSSYECTVPPHEPQQIQPQLHPQLPYQNTYNSNYQHHQQQNPQAIHNNKFSDNNPSQGTDVRNDLLQQQAKSDMMSETSHTNCSSTNTNTVATITSSNCNPHVADNNMNEILFEMNAAIQKAQSDRSIILESLSHQANTIRAMEEERISMERSFQEQREKATIALQQQEHVVENLKRQKNAVSSLLMGRVQAISIDPSLSVKGDNELSSSTSTLIEPDE